MVNRAMSALSEEFDRVTKKLLAYEERVVELQQALEEVENEVAECERIRKELTDAMCVIDAVMK